MESGIFDLLRTMIAHHFEMEVMAAQCTIRMVSETIEACVPLRVQWLLAPDAVAVMNNELVVPAPVPPPEPTVNEFFTSHLNPEQVSLIQRWMESITTGSVILEQDMHAMLDRGFQGIGPLGMMQLSHAAHLHHLTLPRQWRSLTPLHVTPAAPAPSALHHHAQSRPSSPAAGGTAIESEKPSISFQLDDPSAGQASVAQEVRVMRDQLRKLLVPVKKLAGINEHMGVVNAQDTFDAVTDVSILSNVNV